MLTCLYPNCTNPLPKFKKKYCPTHQKVRRTQTQVKYIYKYRRLKRAELIARLEKTSQKITYPWTSSKD